MEIWWGESESVVLRRIEALYEFVCLRCKAARPLECSRLSVSEAMMKGDDFAAAHEGCAEASEET